MKLHKLLLATLACTWALGASAQWQWLDKDGRKVFSDRPPSLDIPQKNIIKEPRSPEPTRPAAKPVDGDASAVAAAPGAPASVAAPALPAGTGKDKKLEENKAKADAAEAAKKQAEADRTNRSREENCARARKSRNTLTSGQIVGHTDDKGNRGFMDDATRASEIKRADTVIASDCGNPATPQ